MKKILLAAALMLLSVIPAFGTANLPEAPKSDLAKATLAVYQGKQVCKWTVTEGFFFDETTWGCEFKTRFLCSATVVEKDGRGSYLGLTAGHCFDWAAAEKGEYYVADALSDKPVVHRISLNKFENDARYDYALFSFRSYEDYPAIPVASDVDPKVGDVVENVNYALGLTKQSVAGKIVSGIITDPIPQFEDSKGRFLASIGIGPGASGSAVINEKGEIIGIVEAVFPSTQMPTLVMPTGKNLLHFMEDDSAGLRPRPAGPMPAPKAEPSAHVPSFKELVLELLNRIIVKIKHLWS